jgi:hypothetical protein
MKEGEGKKTPVSTVFDVVDLTAGKIFYAPLALRGEISHVLTFCQSLPAHPKMTMMTTRFNAQDQRTSALNVSAMANLMVP